VDPTSYLHQAQLTQFTHTQFLSKMKLQHQQQQRQPSTTSMTSMPSDYYTNSPSSTPGLRRSSISSTVSWDSSCDSSLPSTPGGSSSSSSVAYHHSQKSHSHSQQSFTDTFLALDEGMDNDYSHLLAPNLLCLHQYPHPYPPHHHQQHHPCDDDHRHDAQLDHEDHDVSDGCCSPPPSRSQSECGDSNNDHPAYLRRRSNLDTGLDHHQPQPLPLPPFDYPISEANEICISPPAMNYGSPTYTSPPNVFEYPSSSSTSSDAALDALRLCYYPTSPTLGPRTGGTRGLKVAGLASSSKKSKGSARLPLIVTSDEKPHICTIATCDMRFKRQEHLRRHERTHTDERPFLCDVCGKRFSRTDNLKSHRKTHMKKTGRNIFVPGLE